MLTLDQVDVTELLDLDNVRTCECTRSFGRDKCVNEAAWLYLMRCCGAQSFVCEQHHIKHLTSSQKGYYCVKCHRVCTSTFISELVLKTVRI